MNWKIVITGSVVSTSSAVVCEHLLVSITDIVEVMSYSIYVEIQDIIDRSLLTEYYAWFRPQWIGYA